MKVSEIPYERYTVEQAKQAAQGIIERIKNARTAEEIKAARDDFNALSEQIETASSLANCRFTLNTRDEFYNAEMDYYDSAAPLFAKIQNEYERAMLSSPLRAEAEKLIIPEFSRRLRYRKRPSPTTLSRICRLRTPLSPSIPNSWVSLHLNSTAKRCPSPCSEASSRMTTER